MIDSQLGSLIVKIMSDTAGLESGLGKADTLMKSFGSGMASAGMSLTAGVTLPLVGIGAAALKSATDINGMMANVASLGIGTDRVLELKESVQDLSIEMGKGTSDMADGLYQVVSAFGDSSDSVAILENAAKTGAAGLATTTDALNLLATVTKGYGDESLTAQKKVSDLAFQTVNLGQTTFPELAASMGKVVPLAAALGVSQEELFAQMATLTGVTGTAAEVTTQLRATYQAILSPTKEMSSSILQVTSEIDKQGKLVQNDFTKAWYGARQRYREAADASFELKNKQAALEQQMASESGTTSYSDQLKALRLETKRNVLTLEEQMNAIDQSTETGKAQADAIGEQIDQIKLLSEKRELELQGQILATSGNKTLADEYKSLSKDVKNAEKAAEDSYKSFLKNSEGMGTTIVQSVGLTDAMNMLSATANGNTSTLTHMFGSVEALNAVLALSGGQADSFEKKLAAMGNASGATDSAFTAQTQGINAMGFTMQQVWAKVEVLMQKLGDGLAPTMMRLLDNPITPLIDKIADLADWFANSDTATQDWIITIGAIAAAAGPVLVVLGTLISAISTVAGAFGAVSAAIPVLGGVLAALTGPIGLIVAAVGGLAYAWYNNWGGIRDFTDSVFGDIDLSFDGLKNGMSRKWEEIKAMNWLGWEDYKAIANGALSAVENSLGLSQGTIKTKFAELWTSAKDTVLSIDWIGLGSGIIKLIVDGITSVGSAIADATHNIAGGLWNDIKGLIGLGDNVGSVPMQQTTGINSMPQYAGAGVTNTYNVTVNLTMQATGTDDAKNGARSGVLEAFRAIGLG